MALHRRTIAETRDNKMKIGDLVQVKHEAIHKTQTFIGILTDIKKKKELFSDTYSIVRWVTYLHVLCKDKVEIFNLEDCSVEVINKPGVSE